MIFLSKQGDMIMRKLFSTVVIAALMLSLSPMVVFAATPVTLYVSPGSVGGNGSFEKPYGSILEAKTAIRSINKATTSGITVYLRGGVYRFSNTINITNQDVGTEKCPIIYTNYQNEKVELLGSLPISGDSFTAVTDASVLARLDHSVRAKVKQLDLTAAGITREQYGELAYPGMHQYSQLSGSTDLFLDGEAMTLARYPNEGYMNIESVHEVGSNPSGGDTIDASGAFTIGYGETHESHIDRWTTATDAKMYGYWRWGWADQTLDMASVNPIDNTITSALPSYYSVASGDNQRFYVYNLIEELDTPGEYYIDREKNILYFYPPSDLNGKTLSLSTLTSPFFALTNTEYITISGMNMSQSRGNGVQITGIAGGQSSNILISDCCFSYLKSINGSAGGTISGNNNGLLRCSFEHIDGGITLSGGDKETLTHGNNFIKNCYFNDFSRCKRTYNPAILVRGTGQIISNNEITNGPHNAILFSGEENTIEYNEIYEVMTECTDAGAIYCGANMTERGNQVRYNYIHDLDDTLHSGNVNEEWCHGIYVDDNFSGANVIGNVLKNITGYGVFIGGGRDNIVDNNVFYNCERGTVYIDQRGIWCLDPGEGFAEGGKYIKQLQDSKVSNSLWQTRYPEVSDMLKEFTEATTTEAKREISYPKNNVVKNNVYVTSGEETYAELAQRYGSFQANMRYSENPGFVSENDFSLTENARLKTDNPQYIEIPFKSIGNSFPVVDIFFASAKNPHRGNTFTEHGAILDVATNDGFFEEFYTLQLTERVGANVHTRALTESELKESIIWTYPNELERVSNRMAKSPTAADKKVNLRVVEIQDGGIVRLAYNRKEGSVIREFSLGASYVLPNGRVAYNTSFDFSCVLRSFTPTLTDGETTLLSGDTLVAGNWTPTIAVSNQDGYFRGFYVAALYEKDSDGNLTLVDTAVHTGYPIHEKTKEVVGFSDKRLTVTSGSNSIIKMFVWEFNGSSWTTNLKPLVSDMIFVG